MRLAALLLSGFLALEACSGSITNRPPTSSQTEPAAAAPVEKTAEHPGSRLLPLLVFVGSAVASFFGVFGILSTMSFQSESG